MQKSGLFRLADNGNHATPAVMTASEMLNNAAKKQNEKQEEQKKPHSFKPYSPYQDMTAWSGLRDHVQNGRVRSFIEPSEDDENLSDVMSFMDTAPIDMILRSTKNPAGFRHF